MVWDQHVIPVTLAVQLVVVVLIIKLDTFALLLANKIVYDLKLQVDIIKTNIIMFILTVKY